MVDVNLQYEGNKINCHFPPPLPLPKRSVSIRFARVMILTKVAWGGCGVLLFTFAKIVSYTEHYGLVSTQNRAPLEALEKYGNVPSGLHKMMGVSSHHEPCNGFH